MSIHEQAESLEDAALEFRRECEDKGWFYGTFNAPPYRYKGGRVREEVIVVTQSGSSKVKLGDAGALIPQQEGDRLQIGPEQAYEFVAGEKGWGYELGCSFEEAERLGLREPVAS